MATNRDMPEDSAWVQLVPCTPETAACEKPGSKAGRASIAAGSNSCLLYKTHQNLISTENPSVKQCISFVSLSCHMDVPHKEYQWNKRRWRKQRKIITDLRAVGAL